MGTVTQKTSAILLVLLLVDNGPGHKGGYDDFTDMLAKLTTNSVHNRHHNATARVFELSPGFANSEPAVLAFE